MSYYEERNPIDGGYEYVAWGAIPLADALADMTNPNRISIASMKMGTRYEDCRYISSEATPDEDCVCSSRYIGRAAKPRLRAHSVCINPMTGEMLDPNTPILSSVQRFLTRIYSYENPRTLSRMQLVG